MNTEEFNPFTQSEISKIRGAIIDLKNMAPDYMLPTIVLTLIAERNVYKEIIDKFMDALGKSKVDVKKE